MTLLTRTPGIADVSMELPCWHMHGCGQVSQEVRRRLGQVLPCCSLQVPPRHRVKG